MMQRSVAAVSRPVSGVPAEEGQKSVPKKRVRKKGKWKVKEVKTPFGDQGKCKEYGHVQSAWMRWSKEHSEDKGKDIGDVAGRGGGERKWIVKGGMRFLDRGKTGALNESRGQREAG